jgi:hypothetical protein
LRAATGSPVAMVEFVELCGRGLTSPLLSDDAAETLVSDDAAGAVLGSSTVLTAGSVEQALCWLIDPLMSGSAEWTKDSRQTCWSRPAQAKRGNDSLTNLKLHYPEYAATSDD